MLLASVYISFSSPSPPHKGADGNNKERNTENAEEKKQRSEIGKGGWKMKVIGPDNFGHMILENLRKAGVQNSRKGERLHFDSLDVYAGEAKVSSVRELESGWDVGISFSGEMIAVDELLNLRVIKGFTDSGWEYVGLESVETYVAGNAGCLGLGATPAQVVSYSMAVFKK